jgi:GNAT superfamily N-acetyltransferase
MISPKSEANAVATCLRRLHSADDLGLASLGRDSGLDSLREDANRRRLLRDAIVLGAFDNRGVLVGCSCIDTSVERRYTDLSGNCVAMPQPNIYLCSTFVHPDHRQGGIGTSLYRHRLALVQQMHISFIAVEILGTGRPYSVHPAAVAGYSFHRRAAFIVDGCSLDHDLGPVMVRRPG